MYQIFQQLSVDAERIIIYIKRNTKNCIVRQQISVIAEQIIIIY